MADLIPEGEHIQELGATFRGGATLVLRNQRDFDFMEFACSFVEQSSEPLHLLYGLLHTPGFADVTLPTHSALDDDAEGDGPNRRTGDEGRRRRSTDRRHTGDESRSSNRPNHVAAEQRGMQCDLLFASSWSRSTIPNRT